MKKSEIIKKFESAKDTHLVWAREQAYRRRRKQPQVKHVGKETNHRKWVKIYTEAIKLLSK